MASTMRRAQLFRSFGLENLEASATISVHPDILKVVGERDDLEEFLNHILLIYVSGGFIRKSDVAGTVVAKKVYRRDTMAGFDVFDTVSQEFKGVVITNETASQSIFISSGKLMDLLEENQVVAVLKSPRHRGISTVKSKEFIAPLAHSEDFYDDFT